MVQDQCVASPPRDTKIHNFSLFQTVLGPQASNRNLIEAPDELTLFFNKLHGAVTDMKAELN